jgi:hypothetical protein
VAAPAEQRGVDELAAIVAVPFAQGEGQALGEVLDGSRHALVVQVEEGLQLRPARGHVDGDERGAVAARRGLATVQHQIALQGARRDAGPLAPGPHGHLGAQGGQGGREPAGLPRATPTQGPQQPVQRGRARAGERGAYRRRDPHAVMRGQRGEQGGQDRPQQLARELIAGQPRALEEGAQLGRRILRGAAGGPARRTGRAPQPPDGGLAVAAGGATVLVEQSSARSPIGLLIPRAHHRGVFPTR